MLAEEEARRLHHSYISAEHLLLGLVREGNGVGARMLANLGVHLDNVRAAVESIIGRGDLPVPSEIAMTPRAARVLTYAQDEARRLNHDAVGTEHLLLGLTWDADGITTGVLESLGVNPERLRLQMTRILVEQPSLTGSDTAPADQLATLGGLRRSLDAVRRAKDAAITMQEYDRVAQLGDQEVAMIAEIARIEAPSEPTSAIAFESGAAAPADVRGTRTQWELGRSFRHAFDLGMALSPRARSLLERARTQAEMLGQSLIEPEHLLLAITTPGTVLAREMEQRGIDPAVLKRVAESIVNDKLSRGDAWPFIELRADEGR
ncbi:MAG: Clp protease N-terminal domain-containing protein [Dehalococcoidia bacterium]